MIQTTDMRVDYEDVTAVADLNLSIDAGEVYGLIGPNGAGKTSTIRVLATLQLPTYGEVRVGGVDALEDPRGVHRILGYMPDLPPVYEDLRCWEFLDLFASAYFVERRERRARVEECLEIVNLQGKRHAMAGTLSRGMTQRLVLAKTILPDPKVLLLDEPASGLDPIARIDLRNALRRFAGEGKTVLVSSHILTELQEMCTSIGIMERGRLLTSGSLSSIVEQMGKEHRRLHIEVMDTEANRGRLLETLDGVGAVTEEKGRFEVVFAGDESAAVDLLRGLVQAGIPVKSFSERKIGVEDILLKVGAREVS
ncbi:MAG: ABC transporter ATP-binding protein [Phycisphaeraceae bacterium]|nr:ABC transporter ATP-binding protein [Phycisphaeraceae bacterium]